MSRSGRREIAVLGAPSSIGIRPYDDERSARRLDLAPAVMRDRACASRLVAILGRVLAAQFAGAGR